MIEGVSFKSEAHKARFLMAMQEIGKVYAGKLDEEYGAALFILTASSATWAKARGYVSHDGIDFAAMLEEGDFSGGYSVLITLAGNLFNGNQHIGDVRELLRLDEGNFQVAIAALHLRRHSYPVADL